MNLRHSFTVTVEMRPLDGHRVASTTYPNIMAHGHVDAMLNALHHHDKGRVSRVEVSRNPVVSP